MTHLDLKPAISSSFAQGDFGAEFSGQTILLPPEVMSAFERLAVRNGAELVSYLHAFPASAASALGWSFDEVLKGRARLLDQLRGVLPEEVLKPGPIPARGFGALPPLAP